MTKEEIEARFDKLDETINEIWLELRGLERDVHSSDLEDRVSSMERDIKDLQKEE